MKPGHTGLTHLVHSTRYSWKGLKAAVMLSLIMAGLTWGLLGWEKFFG